MEKTFANNYIFYIFFHYLYFVCYSDSKLFIIYNVRKERDFMILIGNNIKALRNEYKLTQSELAQKLGVTKSTVSAYENDTRLPSYDVLIRLSQVFRTSTDSIINDTGAKTIDVSNLDAEQIMTVERLISYLLELNALKK